MGQVALGFRSLLAKAAIFFVMAALLAWALGGTLWPRPVVVDFEPVVAGDVGYWWRLSVDANVNDGQPRWMLMRQGSGSQPRAYQLLDTTVEFDRVSDRLVLLNLNEIAFAGRPATSHRQCEAGQWCLFVADANTTKAWTYPMPDRLAVEQQLARLAAGLPVQDAQTILEQRSLVLDPADDGGPADAEH